MTARLIIVCGLPGSGKTAHAIKLEAEHGAVRLNPDEWMDALAINLWDSEMRVRIEALQWQLAQRLLGVGQCVIIEWGTWSRSERDKLRQFARAAGAKVELHFLDESVDTLFARIQARGRESPPISREDIAEWAAAFERPTAEEMDLFD